MYASISSVPRSFRTFFILRSITLAPRWPSVAGTEHESTPSPVSLLPSCPRTGVALGVARKGRLPASQLDRTSVPSGVLPRGPSRPPPSVRPLPAGVGAVAPARRRRRQRLSALPAFLRAVSCHVAGYATEHMNVTVSVSPLYYILDSGDYAHGSPGMRLRPQGRYPCLARNLRGLRGRPSWTAPRGRGPGADGVGRTPRLADRPPQARPGRGAGGERVAGPRRAEETVEAGTTNPSTTSLSCRLNFRRNRRSTRLAVGEQRRMDLVVETEE